MASLPPGVDLSMVSRGAPPPGTTSNPIDPESLANAMMVVGISMLVLTTVVVFIRLFSNHHATRGLGWEDGSCVIATALFLAFVVASLDLRQHARHNQDLPVSWITPSYLKRLYYQSLSAAPMIFFAKSSLLLLYYRLFKVKTIIRYAIIFGLTLNTINCSINFIVTAIMCSPKVGHGWNLETVIKCEHGDLTGLIRGITNLALDVFLLILPIPVIMPLQLSVKKKIGILAVFMVGSFALVAGIIFTIYQAKISHHTDPAWNGAISIVCVIIETGLTIICSSAAALVNFWKSHISTSIAPLYSRLCSRYGKHASRFKVVSRGSSNNKNGPSQPDQTKLHPNWYSLNCLRPDEQDQKLTGGSGSAIRTEIGGGTPRSDVENGVIRKFIKLEQSFN